MSTFDRLAELTAADGPGAALDFLIETLRSEKNHHKLFDALLLKKKHELGLPTVNPTSLEDVPEEQRAAFEQYYIESAREVGTALLENGQIQDAWVYFRTIGEPEVVAQTLNDTVLPDDYEKAQELINIALYEGANPVRGLEFLLSSNGTCNTITALDQAIGQFAEDDRQKAAAMMTRHLYDELCQTVKAEVDQRMTLPPGAGPQTLRELIMGRDWIFQEGNYHVDVSHLNSVVRFARFLDPTCPEMDLAMQLCEYGCQLDQQFQYPGEPPFEDFYPAHLEFFHVVTGRNVDSGMKYFEQKLADEPDEPDQQLIAYVMVDLLLKADRIADAVELASRHLKFVDQQVFSFAELCLKAGQPQAWATAAKEQGDLVSFAAALVQN
ncbi:MAG: hypothetical protein VB858_20970 [Planctomycetaceae bacterium]